MTRGAFMVRINPYHMHNGKVQRNPVADTAALEEMDRGWYHTKEQADERAATLTRQGVFCEVADLATM